MATCAYCNTTIFFGGVREGELRFCNQKCHQQGMFLAAAYSIPADVIQPRVIALHQGTCPQCRSMGPVDVHVSHSIWSALLLTSWKSQPRVSCRPCGQKAKIGAAVGSFFLGWWGFPWGILITPIQVTRNLVGLAKKPTDKPSPELERIVRLTLAAELQASPSAGIPPAARKA